ncbi:hypothetical protein HDV64DRAFT_275925 [Trichoderma sp. TUCIM 5745]
MYQRKVPPKKHKYRSRDHTFRVSFSTPLSKTPPRLSREGYIRALELYGREDILLDALQSSVYHFKEWRKQNPGDLEHYRRYANSLGYDWERGSVTEEGIYTSYVPATAEAAPSFQTTRPHLDRESPGLARDISQFTHFHFHVDDIDETVKQETMTRDPDGRFAAMNRQQAGNPSRSRLLHNQTVDVQAPGSSARSPVVIRDVPPVLQGAPGNLRFVPGDDHNNSLGAAAIARIATNMLRALVNKPDEVTADDMADIRAMLNYIGSDADMEKFVKALQAKDNPQTSQSVDIRVTPVDLHFVPGEDDRNAAGASGLLLIALAILRDIAAESFTINDLAALGKMFDYIGPEEETVKYVDHFKLKITVPSSQN